MKIIIINSAAKTASTSLFESIVLSIQTDSEYVVIHTHDMKYGFIWNHEPIEQRFMEKNIIFEKYMRWVETNHRLFYSLESNSFNDIFEENDIIKILGCIRDPITRRISWLTHRLNLVNSVDNQVDPITPTRLVNFYNNILNDNIAHISDNEIFFVHLKETQTKLNKQVIYDEFLNNSQFKSPRPYEYEYQINYLQDILNITLNLDNFKEHNYVQVSSNSSISEAVPEGSYAVPEGSEAGPEGSYAVPNINIILLKIEYLNELQDVINEFLTFPIDLSHKYRDKNRQFSFYICEDPINYLIKELKHIAISSENMQILYNTPLIKQLGYELKID
jgi:hypothetical protein